HTKRSYGAVILVLLLTCFAVGCFGKHPAQIFHLLEQNGIKTALVETLNDTEQLVKKCKIFPLEIIARNIATGSLTKRLGITDGTELPFTLVEFCYKDDDLGDPLINDEHAIILGAVSSQSQIDELKAIARKINEILFKFFAEKGLKLVDFKIELGLDKDGNILLADEISPDSCRFWDAKTNQKLDKDVFRQNLGNVKVAYEEVLRRILN
ncbi:MAG: phosphoribosylaminoimidazolesuccinocarboxamide synthase, partial [Campylobacter sp.]|nr:phosphoribosylaminoimidazolesuccinocarboxamide synthase [Campylobacter sp.]